jgi:NADPH:quinone reductase-like Zn-dependent oxidoreductase
MGVMGSVENIGIEGSGVVRSTGNKVNEIKAGDHVIFFGDGMMRTRKTVTEDRCIKIPSNLSLEDAATMPAVFATAIYSLLHIGLLEKDQVRINWSYGNRWVLMLDSRS